VEVKVQAMREHWNQRKKPYMKPEAGSGKNGLSRSQAKVDYAEGLKWPGWFQLYKEAFGEFFSW